MTGQTRFTMLAATLLLGASWLTSCAVTTPQPLPATAPGSLSDRTVDREPIEEIIVSSIYLEPQIRVVDCPGKRPDATATDCGSSRRHRD